LSLSWVFPLSRFSLRLYFATQSECSIFRLFHSHGRPRPVLHGGKEIREKGPHRQNRMGQPKIQGSWSANLRAWLSAARICTQLSAHTHHSFKKREASPKTHSGNRRYEASVVEEWTPVGTKVVYAAPSVGNRFSMRGMTGVWEEAGLRRIRYSGIEWRQSGPSRGPDQAMRPN